MNYSLKIESQRAEIGIKTTPAQMTFTRPRSSFRINNNRPEMKVEHRTPTFKVDWARIRSESGYMSLSYERMDRTQRNLRSIAEGLSRVVQEGNSMGAIERGGDAVAQNARARNLNDDVAEINVGLMPKSSPNVTWDKGHFEIEWSAGDMKLDWNVENKPKVQFEPHSVEIFLSKYPDVRITVTAKEPPGSRGRVDREI